MWTPVIVAAAAASALVSASLILCLWIRHRRDSLFKRCLWSLVLLVPVIGWIFYGGLYQPPSVQPEDMRAKETPGI